MAKQSKACFCRRCCAGINNKEISFPRAPTWVHGRLTKTCNKIKSNENFAKIAEKIGFEKYMDIVALPADNIKLRAGVIEAVFGAIYLKRGFKEAKRLADSINFIEEAIASIEQ